MVQAPDSIKQPLKLSTMAIRFGTSGWQATVAAEFTFVATSHHIYRVAYHRMRPVLETPVGFKSIGELINEDKIILGGDESAGVSIKGHYPEKGGILACLLAAEAVAARGSSLSEQCGRVADSNQEESEFA